ncbi:MAG: Wzz/FepE/Etk N-terminal domain-containing protein [Acetobacteraceae bacterium]|jgi:capsular exopolysaccharide synthesis family protein
MQTDIALSSNDDISQPVEWRAKQGYHTPPTGPKILGLGRTVLRRGKLLFTIIVLLNLLAFFGIHQVTPRYTASADVLVGPREEQVVDLKAVLSGLSGSSDVIESEIQVLRSREIARAVVQKLHLDQLTEFNPALRPPGPLKQIQGAFTSGWSWVEEEISALAGGLGAPSDSQNAASASSPSAAADGSASSETQDPLSAPVDRFLSQLDVASKGRSRVITVSFTSTDATLSAKVTNAVADAYIANQLRAKTEATSQAHQWLDERVTEQREQLLAEDEAVEAYRKRAGIIPMANSTLLNQQISEVGQELMKAQEQVSDAEGRLQAVANINPNAQGMVREVAMAKEREQRIAATLDNLRQKIDAGSQSEIGLRALQREADADRNLYDRLLQRARETKIQSGLQQPDATIISRAERPQEASFPKPLIILPLYFISSCIISFLIVLWLESLDGGFLTPAQIESTLGIPAIGAIPFVKPRFLGRGKVENYALARPRSDFAEAIRNLHTSLILSGKDGVPKTILIASSLSGEGKSSIALSIASMMAKWGRRVVVVDCDLRNPTIHKSFDVPEGPGLTECLTGHVDLELALRRDPNSSAYFLTAGKEGMLAPDLFASNAMRNLVEALSRSFELVLLDGGPVLGTSDTRHLCRLADRTVMVIRWRDTRCAAAMLGLRQLADAGASFAGAILTMVDPKHYQKYAPVGTYRRRLALYLSS